MSLNERSHVGRKSNSALNLLIILLRGTLWQDCRDKEMPQGAQLLYVIVTETTYLQ